MRISLILLPLSLCAAPALAQPVPPAIMQLPPELTDPATADRLTDAMQSLSQALLDMRVGNIKAAIEGRRASPARAAHDRPRPCPPRRSQFRPPPASADRGREAQAPAGHPGD